MLVSSQVAFVPGNPGPFERLVTVRNDSDLAVFDVLVESLRVAGQQEGIAWSVENATSLTMHVSVIEPKGKFEFFVGLDPKSQAAVLPAPELELVFSFRDHEGFEWRRAGRRHLEKVSARSEAW